MTVGNSLRIIAIISVMNIVMIVGTRLMKLRRDATRAPRDYRPSKWLANSAMDVWYGNKSFVEILSREFNDVVERIALRPVRDSSQEEATKKHKQLTIYKYHKQDIRKELHT